MDYKVVVSDPKTGKSYQVDVKDDQGRKLRGKRMGESFDGAILGLPGYKLEITGGSDKAGFPMKRGVHSTGAVRILMGDGVGFKAKGGQRVRRRVHGESIGDDVVQVNAKVVEYGGKGLDAILVSDKPKEGGDDAKKKE